MKDEIPNNLDDYKDLVRRNLSLGEIEPFGGLN